jgi:hypothetical protein
VAGYNRIDWIELPVASFHPDRRESDLKNDEPMHGTKRAVGRAVELKRASTREADRAAILLDS